MIYLFAIVVLTSCAIAFYNWRWGIFAAVVIALIQDPIRKMIPGTPGILSMSSLPVWLAAIMGALQIQSFNVRSFLGAYPRWGQSVQWFAVYLLVPASLSITYGRGSWMIALLGAMVFGVIFFALQLGWKFAHGDRDLMRLLSFYTVTTSVLLIGGPLEYLGWNQRLAAIGTEALDHIWVTYRTGAAVFMISGLFRSPDIMGWHAIMVFMVAVILAVRSKGAWRYFWIGVAIWGAANVWLCGRRKMIAMMPIFVGVYLLLIYRLQHVRRLVPALAVICIAIGIGWQLISQYFYSDAVERFYLTAFEEADEQLYRHAIQSVQETIRQAGFFGYGLGMGQQGIHHINAETPRIWQESGPSKLVLELGVPGSLLFLLVLYRLGMTLYAIIRRSVHQPVFYVACGIFAVLVANGMSALVSAQIYGDVFVVVWLAVLTGLLLSMHFLVQQQSKGDTS